MNEYKRLTYPFIPEMVDTLDPDTNVIHWIEVNRKVWNELRDYTDKDHTFIRLIGEIPLFNGIQIKWNDLLPDGFFTVVYSECESIKDRTEKVFEIMKKLKEKGLQ